MSVAHHDRTGENLAARDRHRAAVAAALSPAERLEALRRLLAQANAALAANPAGAAAFLKRNYKSRAVTLTTSELGDGS
jgi:hypothetical protein